MVQDKKNKLNLVLSERVRKTRQKKLFKDKKRGIIYKQKKEMIIWTKKKYITYLGRMTIK